VGVVKKDKQKIYLDFDNTIVNSTKAFCDVYNNYFVDVYPEKYGGSKADWTKVKVWNFSDQCTGLTDKDVEDIFASEPFFRYLEFYEGAKKVISKLSRQYDIRLCTMGTPMNVSYKSKWVNTHLSSIKNHIYIVNEGEKIDKTMIDMGGAIFIDDNQNNLTNSNAAVKICYGDGSANWNDNWMIDGITQFMCSDWDTLHDTITKIVT